ncbi:MAG: type I glutamate--ammonia ligase [Bacteroidetes bacterium]|nr:type I glutamate--ammonia ligase [Bacteroidota bacterium]MCL5738562.1 type I glutamate--ammonia ligase [Bacteroidota bacterium]
MAKGAKSANEVDKLLKFVKDSGAEIIDLRFTDIPGQWQHFSILPSELKESSFDEGVGFDGSSIRGFQSIQESDMVLIPDATRYFMDPFTAHKTLDIICDVKDPITGEPYRRDPRFIAHKAEAYVRSTGLADSAFFGPEAEFFIFDNVRFDQTINTGFYEIDSDEGSWNSGSNAKQNLGYRPKMKEGYFPVPPIDSLQDIRSEMVLTMKKVGIEVEVHHHEVATAGQTEIDMRFNTLTHMADNLMTYKYITKNVAAKHNKTVTFMPKPLYGDNGSGMHVHQSLWKAGKPLFYGNGYANLSEMALYYIGGLLKHAAALCAIINPTTNSYHRLVPGFEAPVNLAYSQRNRSAAARIPMYSKSPKAKRVEYRVPDPSTNPYLAFSALLMAGLDGIVNKIDPGEPLDKDIYDLSPEELRNVPSTPGSLEEALKALERDHEFLLRGDVFTEDLVSLWIKYKMANEVKQVALRPHPYEFMLYYDI